MPAATVIKEAMEKRGLRNRDLEPIIGSRGHTSEIIAGKRGVPKTKAVALAKLLRVPLSKLLEG